MDGLDIFQLWSPAIIEGEEFDLQDLQILKPVIFPSLHLFLNQALRHFFEVL